MENGNGSSGGFLKKGYYYLVQGENFLGHFLLLAIRIYWGGLLVITGLGKLRNAGNVGEYFSTLNIHYPLFSAYFVGAMEFLGGLSLFFGLFSRIMTIPLVIIFTVAYMTAHSEALINLFINPSLFIMQEPFLFLYASLIVLCFGPGAISIDYWLEKKKFGRAL